MVAISSSRNGLEQSVIVMEYAIRAFIVVYIVVFAVIFVVIALWLRSAIAVRFSCSCSDMFSSGSGDGDTERASSWTILLACEVGPVVIIEHN